MKKYLVLLMITIMTVIMCCSCGDKTATETQQVWKASFEVEEDWLAYITTPTPADSKMYSYKDYFVSVNFVKNSQDFEKKVMDTALKASVGTFKPYSTEVDEQNSKEICGMETYTAKCVWTLDETGNQAYYSMITGINAEYGIYVFNVYTSNSEDFASVKKWYKKIIKSIELTEEDDPEVFAKDIGQVSFLQFSMDGWDRRMVHNDVVAYLSESDLEYYMMIKYVEWEELEFTEENLCNTVMSIYSGAYDKAELLEQKAPVKTKAGNAIWTSFKLSMGENSTNTSTLFICDDNGRIIACFMVSYDEELKADYKEIIDTVQFFDEHEEQLENLWDHKTEYTGENDNVVALVSDVGFRDYTVELKTEAEPYGLIVKVKDGDLPDSLDKECILLLGLIGNLDHVTIVTDTDTYKMNVDQACSILKYDVKKLGQSKPLLERYLLKNLWL